MLVSFTGLGSQSPRTLPDPQELKKQLITGWPYANGGLLCAGLVAVVAEGLGGGGGEGGGVEQSGGGGGGGREPRQSRVSLSVSSRHPVMQTRLK